MMKDNGGPYLAMAVFCEKVIKSDQGVLSLINIVDRHNVMAVGDAPTDMPPQTINWFLVLSFRSGLASGSFQVKITPEDPGGIKGSGAFEVPIHLEGRNRGANVVAQINFKAEEPGIYWFWIELDGQFVTKIPLEVIYGRTATVRNA